MDFVFDKKKLFVLFISFIMLSSIFAFVFLSSTFNQTPSPPTTLPPEENPTGIQFEAQSVPAKVVRLLPLVIISSRTTEPDISKINNGILGLESVNSIAESYYAQDPTATGGLSLVYVANVSLKEDADTEKLLADLYGLPFFEAPELLRAGLISLPKTVSFENKELSLSQVHEFSNPLSNAFLSPLTRKDDEITASLQATISGQTLLDLTAIEETNITATPSQKAFVQELPVSGLSENLFVSFTAPADFLGKEKETETEITESVENAIEATISKNSFGALSLQLVIDRDLNVFRQDIETLLADVNSIQSLDFLPDQNTLVVLIEETSFSGTKQAILEKLSSINFSPSSVSDPRVPYSAQVTFSSNALAVPSSMLVQLLEQKGMAEISMFQQSTFETQLFFDADSNESFEFPGQNFSALILPTHSVGSPVTLEVSLSISRGEIVSVNAIEKTETE